MIKVAIFENEKEYCEAVFNVANIKHFGNKLQYEWFATSQEFGELSEIKNYSLALVDLDLSTQTQLDGYKLLEKLLEYSDNRKIIILSGASRIGDNLRKRGLPGFKIIKKPVQIEDIKSKFINAGLKI